MSNGTENKKADIIGNGTSVQDGKFFNIAVKVENIDGLIVSEAKRKQGQGLPPHLFTNKAGDLFLKLKCIQKKEVGTYGDTHFVILDDYQPEKK
jgi:hypothetical protein